jgi:hypothetical protein
MGYLKPITLHDPGATTRSSTRAGRKIVVASPLILTVSATIAWFGIAGWRFIEILLLAATSIKMLWTTFLRLHTMTHLQGAPRARRRR